MTRISSCWNHDPAHFSFYRATPRNQRCIPFDAASSPTRGEAAGFLVAACALVGLFAVALGS